MAFMVIRKASNTRIAAEVRLTNPRSGLSAQMKIWVGKAVALSNGDDADEVMNAFIPISYSGAVSPKARARPMIVPVRIPGIASGRTC